MPHLGALPTPHSRQVLHPGVADALASQLVVHATSNGWPARGLSPFQLGRRLAAAGDADMKPVLGSLLHFTPDDRGWLAQLVDDQGRSWPEPVIGWGVVVCWTGYESEDPKERQERPDHYETRLEPILFDGSEARTATDLGEGITLLRLHMPGYGGLLAAPPQPPEVTGADDA
uniref:hypothetical protein n=1 Tax=Pseudonocardia sp. CA-138482 TaxID=3240023 RepID=UPI003F49429A